MLVNKWENGLARPPDQETSVEHLARDLKLADGSEEARGFVRAAEDALRCYVPHDLTDEELLAKMPAAHRGVRAGDDPDDIVEQARDVAREAYGPEK